jgi:RNA polymerase sigma-70 factor (ECF subfamily)
MMVLSDEQLLDSYRRGSREALEELFQRYRDTAYRVAFRLLGRDADALDAVQEGFIKALTHLDGFEARSSFKTWLLRIVSNASLDLGRQRRRREAHSLEAMELRDQEVDPRSLQDEAGNLVDHADLREQLDAALRELPESQRTTFVLHVDGEMSYREIADTLKISIGTVMSRLFYARQRLKGLLSNRLKS